MTEEKRTTKASEEAPPPGVDFDTIEALRSPEGIAALGEDRVGALVKLVLLGAAVRRDVDDARLRAAEQLDSMKAQVSIWKRKAVLAEAEVADLRPKHQQVEARYLAVLDSVHAAKRKLAAQVKQ